MCAYFFAPSSTQRDKNNKNITDPHNIKSREAPDLKSTSAFKTSSKKPVTLKNRVTCGAHYAKKANRKKVERATANSALLRRYFVFVFRLGLGTMGWAAKWRFFSKRIKERALKDNSISGTVSVLKARHLRKIQGRTRKIRAVELDIGKL